MVIETNGAAKSLETGTQGSVMYEEMLHRFNEGRIVKLNTGLEECKRTVQEISTHLETAQQNLNSCPEDPNLLDPASKGIWGLDELDEGVKEQNIIAYQAERTDLIRLITSLQAQIVSGQATIQVFESRIQRVETRKGVNKQVEDSSPN